MTFEQEMKKVFDDIVKDKKDVYAILEHTKNLHRLKHSREDGAFILKKMLRRNKIKRNIIIKAIAPLVLDFDDSDQMLEYLKTHRQGYMLNEYWDACLDYTKYKEEHR